MNKETSVKPLENPNNRIWEKICETDPNRTKNFTKGYRGTSINPNYIYEKLTACFGPCGTGWGFTIDKDEFKEGYEGEISHTMTVGLWYKNGEVKSESIPGIGGTQYVFKDKNGWHTDEDAKKKSLTDALTKASQLIGMSADIFGGLWDDCKYVAELREKYKPEETDSSSAETPETPTTPASKPTAKPEQSTTPSTQGDSAPPASGGKKVTKSQAGLLWHKFSEAGFSAEDIEEYCQFHYQVESQYSLPMSAVKVILALFENNELKTVSKEQETDDIPF